MAFIKLQRTSEVDELLQHPLEFALLALIAKRARRKEDKSAITKLEIGEARIGDYQNSGMSRQQYRRCLTNLQKWSLVTIKPTNKGTIARIINTRIFDINAEDNQPTNQPETNQQTNQKPTTKKNIKKQEVKKKEKDLATKNVAKWQDDTKMDLEQFVEWCRKSKQPHVQLIGEWADQLNISFGFEGFETYGEWDRLFFKQNLRAAKTLSVSWTRDTGRDRMSDAIQLLVAESKNGHWKTGNLSTLIKYMSKV